MYEVMFYDKFHVHCGTFRTAYSDDAEQTFQDLLNSFSLVKLISPTGNLLKIETYKEV